MEVVGREVRRGEEGKGKNERLNSLSEFSSPLLFFSLPVSFPNRSFSGPSRSVYTLSIIVIVFYFFAIFFIFSQRSKGRRCFP